MGLLDNLNDAAKKETLDNLPINPTQITIDKSISNRGNCITIVILAGTNNYLSLTFPLSVFLQGMMPLSEVLALPVQNG